MSRPVTERLWFRLLGCLVLGGIGALSMPPFTTPALIVSLSFYWLILTSLDKTWHAWPAGFLYGFGYFLGGIWWVGNALLVGGNPYLWALPFAVSGLQALLALFPMIAAWASQYFWKGRSLGAYLFFLAMLGFWEWGRGHFLTGFPWNPFGAAWSYSLPVLQILSIGGIYMLSLLTVFAASAPAFAWKGEASKTVRYSLPIVAVIIFAALYLWGDQRLKTQTTYDTDVVIQVVTPNIPQNEKWDPALFWSNYTKTLKASSVEANPSDLSGRTRILVLPETALQYNALEDPNAVAALSSTLKAYKEKTYLFTGFLRKEIPEDGSEPRYYNSLVGFDADLNQVYAFDKFHLVPFGEYMPFQKYIPIGPVIGFSGFDFGTGPRTVTVDGAPAFSPLVCYEVIFPGAVTASDGSSPQWMVNVTNDAWYGVSPGPRQHLYHAVYRSVEEGLPLIRSTNTGISAIIDPYGRILTQSPLFESAVQTMALPRAIPQRTFYAAHKDALYFLFLFLMTLPIALRRKK